ncbi:long-chain acyl-CoA synthetase [Entomortierella parvispora]|uniref:Long-chain acyl-CoA synthetase n=1 Tax=Entomortierella parvispora TaxID=205924 RepID=A0A9P3M283_9FUNG|nr:long-chain acyl-CoA synthetase [Entomortierella parvispora]
MVMVIDHANQSYELPGTRRPGQTGIYRRKGYEDKLLTVPPSRPHIRTIYDSFQHGLRVSPNGPALGRRVYNPTTGTYGGYEWQTYVQVNARITRFGSGLIKIHQDAHSHPSITQRWSVGIWAINRSEWTIASEACSAYNLVSVGLYDTLGPEAVVYGINHSECSVIVTSVDHIASLLNDAAKMPGLKVIICMDTLDTTKAVPGTAAAGSILRTYAQDKGVLLYDWEEVEAVGRQCGRKHTPPSPSDVYTICYTSGTTGMPKGAILTHGNMTSVLASADVTTPMNSTDSLISFLPLPHVFGRVMEIFVFSAGGKIGYSTGDQLLLLEDIAHLKPTVFPAVPRLLNRVYAKICAATVDAPGLTGALARRGVATKLENLKAGKGFLHPFWDRILFSKIKQALGGNVRLILTASAPISAEILGFVRVAFCCEVIEAYGQTEGSGAATNTNPDETDAGHVGPPNACSEIKLVDVPELNYFATDKPYPRGEICVRGPGIIPGYLKDEAKTKETIDEEGWLHSGDIGIIGGNGTITVIDRKKNVFKLSQGEYIAAENIEGRYLSRVNFIQQLFIHGDSTESCLVAVLVPEPDMFAAFVNKTIEGSNLDMNDKAALKAICADPKATRAVLQELINAGKEIGLRGFEVPRAILLEPEPFTVENDLMTPTFKIKRHPVVQHYREKLTALYKDIHQKDSKL